MQALKISSDLASRVIVLLPIEWPPGLSPAYRRLVVYFTALRNSAPPPPSSVSLPRLLLRGFPSVSVNSRRDTSKKHKEKEKEEKIDKSNLKQRIIIEENETLFNRGKTGQALQRNRGRKLKKIRGGGFFAPSLPLFRRRGGGGGGGQTWAKED